MKRLCERPAEVECALWFHDAIYEPMSKSNEERSANWATELLSSSGAAQDVVDRIRSHIMATRHEALTADADSRVVVDIDLSILGAEPSRYEEFERDVRKEYRWVPRFIYGPKRAAILQSFLDRPRIYQTKPMFDRFEERARLNVPKAVRALSDKSSTA
jgi:predicted metal-dependent HD superfamily phosphohydrolase